MMSVSPLAFIRIHVLSVRQADLAHAIGVSAMAWSRWESGQRAAPINIIRPVLKSMAEKSGLPWEDSWLFELPICNQCVGLDSCQRGCARISNGCAAIRRGDADLGRVILGSCAAVGSVGLVHWDSPAVQTEKPFEAVGNGNFAPEISQQVPS